jgi:RNA polymerase sigma-70 factor (ECF subfamily)
MMHTPELVAQCLRNQAAAQKQLYDAYAPQMLGICYRYTKNMDEASDVLQEGFVKVFRNLAQWKQEGDLGAWIRRIMVNTALNWLRDHRKVQWVAEQEIPETKDAHEVVTPLQQMQARQLADLIRQLPPGFQTVFNLHAIEGYTHVEIAQMLGISEGTSRSQYMRARKQLAEWILKLTPENEQHYARKS